MTKRTTTLSRQQLYDEIWQMSVAGVARKYNLNYAKLIAKCREANIPFPSSGYWTRKNMGKDVSGEVVALPPSDNENVELLLAGVKSEKKKKVISDAEELHSDMEEGLKKAASSMEEKGKETGNEDQAVSVKETVEKSGADDTVLPFLDSVEKKRVLQAASELRIRDKKRLHEQLIKYRKSMTEWKQKEVQNQREYQRRNRPDDEPAFFNEISPESQQRAFLILDALFCAVEELGGKVNADLSMRVMADTVRIRIAEGQDKVKHELTKQEARALVEYNDKVKRNGWASKPQIRKYDSIYNGKLRIIFDNGEYIRDTGKEKLEDRLGDLLMRLYENSEEDRIQRERLEEERRKREEEARRQAEIQKRKEDEVRRTRELLNQAEDYKIACEIRQYIAAVARQKDITPETAAWIEWANRKADWYDPIVAAEDEYLGRREHSKPKEEKDLDKMNMGRYGMWGW
ncbi:MAG: hypothetical protein KH275_08625 [Clostridiales bacterium]|nr:hypothetical protein [Clostridiales bacterium]